MDKADIRKGVCDGIELLYDAPSSLMSLELEKLEQRVRVLRSVLSARRRIEAQQRQFAECDREEADKKAR